MADASHHLLFLFKRRAGMDPLAFDAYWRDVHAPLVAQLPGVRRYVQNLALPVGGAPPPWDGVAEIWVDDAATAAELLQGRSFRDGGLADEGHFVDPAQVVRLHTVDHVVRAGPPAQRDAALPKRMTFFRRKAGMARDEALRYWQEVHGPLAASAPGPRRYVQSTVSPATPGQDAPPFDGVAQIWFDDAAALQRLLASPIFRESVKPDEGNFVSVDSAFTLATRERRIVWPD